MTIKRSLIALGLVMALPSCGQGPSVEGPAPKLTEVERCYALAEKLRIYGFDRSQKQCRLSVIEESYDKDLMCWEIQVSSPFLEMEAVEGLKEPVYGVLFRFFVHKDSKELLKFSSYHFEDWLSEKQNIPDEELALSKEEAVEHAKGYIEAIGTKMSELVLVSAFYDEYSTTRAKAWRIGFSRQLEGYRFKYDYVNVQVHERHGLGSYYKRFFSVPGPIPKNLVKTDALEEQCIAKVKEMLDAARFKHKGKLVNIKRTWHEVLITNPSMYMYKSEKAKAMKKESAVLVHEYEYTITWYVKKGGRVEENRKVKLSVCFDAGTGEFLCGDYLIF